jgi:histidinol-phosphatase
VDGRSGPGGGSAVATNGKLHDDLLERLSSPGITLA